MDLESAFVALSLGALSAVLVALSARGLFRYYRNRTTAQAMWGLGLSFGAAATLIELVAYLGVVTSLLLQAYVFLSAVIVGTLSLGSTHAFKGARWPRPYAGYIGVASAAVAFFSFTTPLPNSMVQAGIISGNPPILLLVLSSLVTVPATIVLLTGAVLSLRRSFRWKTVMMIAGASVLGAGGAFYVASFPVMLYYAEFIGILLLFIGLVDFSRWASLSKAPASNAVPRTS
jgi:hypothetical protein